MRVIFLGAALCAGLSQAQPVSAETPAPFATFSAKRVKPPQAGARRLTVQIAPRANPAVAPVAIQPTVSPPSVQQSPKGPATSPGTYAWFWQAVSPKLKDSGPGRLRLALDTISAPPADAVKGVTAPRLQALQQIAQSYGTDILRETVGTRVSPALVLAVISVESSGRQDAVSSAGAAGLMQLMPATAERFGVSDRSDPQQNIRGGVAFLDFLMARFDNDPILVLAGYNAGENSIPKHSGVPPYAETRDYVPKVLQAFRAARGLCLTPPQLVTDGCVFSVKSS